MNFNRRRKDNPSSVLPDLPLGAEILVIRLRSIGDVVLTLPAIEALHEWRPDVQKFRSWFSRSARRCRGPSGNLRCFAPDGFLAHGKDAAAAQVRRRLQCARGTHERAADRLSRSAAAGLLGATPVLVRLQRRSSLQFPRRRPRSTPRRGASRAAILWTGMPAGSIPPARVYPQADAIAAVERILAAKGLPSAERYAVLRPGAGDVSKRWPVENFASIARWLRERYALTPVVNIGPGDEEDRRRGQRAPRAAERHRRFAGLAAIDGARSAERACLSETTPGRRTSRLRSRRDAWRFLERAIPRHGRRGKPNIAWSKTNSPASAVREDAVQARGVTVHSHGHSGASAPKPATRCSRETHHHDSRPAVPIKNET